MLSSAKSPIWEDASTLRMFLRSLCEARELAKTRTMRSPFLSSFSRYSRGSSLLAREIGGGGGEKPTNARRDPRRALTTLRDSGWACNDFLSAKIFKAAGKISEPVIRRLAFCR